jgi:catechol 2,3-dioxygenase-like lactoylglutathione lyase family enzyme
MEQEKIGGYLGAIVGYPDASVRMAHLYDPAGRHVIELFEYRAPDLLPADLEPRRIGNAHLCFLVADLHAVYDRLVSAGTSTYSPPVPIDTGVNAGGFGLYFTDPDGITLELFQPAPGTAADALLRQGA